MVLILQLCLTSDCTDIVISCGGERGILHMSRFVCPGIHQECIEVTDGTLTTPKKFSVIGDKCKLKDWKNALRIQGKPIRLVTAILWELFNADG